MGAPHSSKEGLEPQDAWAGRWGRRPQRPDALRPRSFKGEAPALSAAGAGRRRPAKGFHEKAAFGHTVAQWPPSLPTTVHSLIPAFIHSCSRSPRLPGHPLCPEVLGAQERGNRPAPLSRHSWARQMSRRDTRPVRPDPCRGRWGAGVTTVAPAWSGGQTASPKEAAPWPSPPGHVGLTGQDGGAGLGLRPGAGCSHLGLP